jgi:hypothetical protein
VSEDKVAKRSIGNIITKTFAFLVIILSLPIINVLLLYWLFKMVVLNEQINIKDLFIYLNNLNKKKDDDDDDEWMDDEEFTLMGKDDLIPIDVEDITNKYK